jgi:hypothetical protein
MLLGELKVLRGIEGQQPLVHPLRIPRHEFVGH